MRFRKYAMVPINWKNDANGNIIIRRVLVSYKFKIKKKVKNRYVDFLYLTKFIDADDYFKQQHQSHQYVFKNKCYKLINNNIYNQKYLFKKRRYHIWQPLDIIYGSKSHFITHKSAYFEAFSVEDAKKMFRDRTELR